LRRFGRPTILGRTHGAGSARLFNRLIEDGNVLTTLALGSMPARMNATMTALVEQSRRQLARVHEEQEAADTQMRDALLAIKKSRRTLAAMAFDRKRAGPPMHHQAVLGMRSDGDP
jgi:hypothetical protein